MTTYTKGTGYKYKEFIGVVGSTNNAYYHIFTVPDNEFYVLVSSQGECTGQFDTKTCTLAKDVKVVNSGGAIEYKRVDVGAAFTYQGYFYDVKEALQFYNYQSSEFSDPMIQRAQNSDANDNSANYNRVSFRVFQPGEKFYIKNQTPAYNCYVRAAVLAFATRS